jgi:hypothetical protein
MPSVIVISDDEQDEVNVVHRPNLSSPIPPERFLGNPGSSPQGERRAKVDVKIGPPGKRKRRRPSESDEEFVEVKDVSRVKKTKREQRKAVSVFPPASSLILWWRRVLIDPPFLVFSLSIPAYYSDQFAEGACPSCSAQMALPLQTSLYSVGGSQESLLYEFGNGD